METQHITDHIEDAAQIIRAGGLVAVPTETVYGLAGNGLNEIAVKEIYEVKGRPEIKALSLMVPDESAMERYCEDVPPQAHKLAKHFWPGPLTIVLKAKPVIPSIVLAGGTTVGLRCPDHPLTIQLLKTCGLPLAAPSANPSGEPSPKTAEQVFDYFDGRIDAVIDGGPCGIGRESTLIDMSRTPYRILREAALSEEAVAEALAEELTVIGITGPSGCGKTTALRELEALGALVLDCDAVYHELLVSDKALLDELDAAFPGTVRDSALDRKALGRIVFADPDRLLQLNQISHRYVKKEVNRRLRDFAMQGGQIAALDAVELISAGMGERCTATVGVLSDLELRVARIMQRDNISREAVLSRIRAQKPDSYYKTHCTHILFNNADREGFAADSRRLFKELLNHG
ncbi:MAG: threonylcarbamoyl-AMP synthase [Oscillospiraceae bacterium]|nr:threonylcarbamoyl-AMP synthase [Oscillospiraceae bacterium]